MNFKYIIQFLAISLPLASLVPLSAAPVAEYEIGKWANFCEGAVSHTFDDNTAHQTDSGQALFDAKGFHMTLFVITGQVNDWTKYKAAFAKGHEIASHSVTHPGTMPDAESAPSQAAIKKNVPGEMCATIAYPNCNEPTPTTTSLKKCYIAGRVCDGQVGPKTPVDFWRVSCKMAGTAGINTAGGLNQAADQAASSGGWIVWCHHGVANDNHGYSNTPTAVIKGNLAYLDTNRSKFWLETFGNISCYIYERDSAKITTKSSTATSFTISVTDNLPDSIFNYPLTIRRALPSGWTTAIVTQKGVAVQSSIITVNGKQYIMFKAIPDGGDVAIGKEGVGVRGNSSSFGNGMICPVMMKHGTLFIDSRQFNGSALKVTLFDLTGKMLARFTLGKSESGITLPADKISKSTFIVKVTGRGKTYSGTFMLQ